MKNKAKNKLNERVCPQDNNPNFLSIYNGMKDRTLVDRNRCWNIYTLALSISDLDGNVAEVGVYKGGTAYILSKALPNKTIHLFDTFEGMPNTTDPTIDYNKHGDFSDTLFTDVKNFIPDQNVIFHVGFFPQTTESMQDEKFSFVHVDCDIYQSVKDCCEFFFPRMLPHGIMIFDDYGWVICAGARKAVNEFFSDKQERPILIKDGHCLIFKR